MLKMEDSRVKHSIEVARKMEELALEIKPGDVEFAQDMFSLGLVHDMGYQFSKKPEDHAIIGGNILKRQGYKYWKEVHDHSNPDTSYRSTALDILNTADMLTGPAGEDLTIHERLNDIKNRYGKDSIQYINAHIICQQLELIN